MEKRGRLKEKRASLPLTWIAAIILILIAFAILLIFYFNVFDKGDLNDVVCHESVIYRATLPSIVKEYIPLRCRTDKICITSKLFGGKCKEFEGEKGVASYRVSSGDEGEKQMAKLYAEKIYECWQMMGEGKVSLFSPSVASEFGFGGQPYPTCVICDRIAFDKDSLEKAEININEVNILEYMTLHKVSDTNLTYYEAINKDGHFKIDANYNPIEKTEQEKIMNNVSIWEKIFGLKSTIDAQADAKEISLIEPKEPEEMTMEKSTAILFMQISTPEPWDVFKNNLIVDAAVLGISVKNFGLGSMVSSTPGTFSSASPIYSGNKIYLGKYNFASKGPSLFAKIYLALAIAQHAISQTNNYWARSVTASYCTDSLGEGEARSGCSVVRAIPYDAEDISSYCGVIESLS